MTTVTRIEHSHELDQINSIIHDCYFDADRIEYDPSSRLVTIPFVRPMSGIRVSTLKERIVRGRFTGLRALLKIHEVRSYNINDTERIGFYDFNEIRFEEASKTLRILTGIPISVEAQVDRLSIEVDEFEEVVDLAAQEN